MLALALDKTIGVFSPQRQLRRARARAALRIYEGAAYGHRTTSFRSDIRTSANTELSRALGPLRARSHDLVQNTPEATRALTILVSHIVGTGIRPVSNTGSDRIDDQVEELWEEWQEQADVRGMQSFYAMQALAMRGIIESGEVVIRYIDRRPSEFKGEVPLQLQVLEADHIDDERDGEIIAPMGQVRARLGVGLGDYDAPTGLWLYPYHPGESNFLNTYRRPLLRQGLTSTFVPIDQLLHLFVEQRPGQVRGVPWFAPMMTIMRDHTDLRDAITVKARTEACFAAFITQTDEEPVMEAAAEMGRDLASGANPDAMVSMLEPGMIKTLKPTQDIKFAQPSGTTQIEPVVMMNLQAMAAAMGCTYDQISGDLRQANYSSLRAGKIEFHQIIDAIQNHLVIPRLCKPTWDRFIAKAITAGKLKDRKRLGYPVEWIVPALQSVNPKFDQDAEERSVRAGRMTPQEYIAGWGNNWRRSVRQIAEFFKYCDKHKVALDIDVRNYSRAGLKQQTKPNGAAAGGAAGGTSEGAGLGVGGGGGGGEGGGGSSDSGGGGLNSGLMLTDADGNEIDLADLQDLIDSGEGREHGPFFVRGRGPFFVRKREFDPNQPRDSEGKWTDAGGGDKSGTYIDSTAAVEVSDVEKQAPQKVTLGDFARDGIKIIDMSVTVDDVLAGQPPPRTAAFIDQWNEVIKESPAAFKQRALGGLDGTMDISPRIGGAWAISGRFKENGETIGEYSGTVNWADKTANYEYMKLNKAATNKSIAKRVLAGNIAMFQKAGVEKVTTTANIDVGGYAWAKYGFVPTAKSWRELKNAFERVANREERSPSATGYTPESWDEISSDEQDRIFEKFCDDTAQEFLDSEIESWRENGEPLDDAKYQLADNFSATDDWAVEAVDAYLKDAADDGEPVPYTTRQILEAISAEEYRTGYEGRKDPEFSFDDSKLQEPSDAPPKEQMTLPGIERPDLSTHLTQDMRDEIIDRLTTAFNDQAERDADHIEPPEYLSENIRDYQGEVWEGYSDRDKYAWADRHGYIEEQDREIDDEESPLAETVAAPENATEIAALRKLTASSDPKALWVVADSSLGKKLLIGSTWEGVLDLNDKDSMARLSAYVAKAPAHATVH